MNKNIQQLLRLSGILCVIISFAAISYGYVTKPCVINNGGGKAASANYTTIASIGQAGIGPAASSNYKQGVGYLYAASQQPVPTPPPWDPNGDGIVNILDLVIVARNFGQSVPPADSRADVNKDGVVNILDLVLVAKHFGETANTNNPAPTLDSTIITQISQTHSPGDVFTVDIKAENATDLYGFEFELEFDPKVLEVVSVNEGSFLKAGDVETYWMETVVG